METSALRALSGDTFVVAITGGEPTIDADTDEGAIIEGDELAAESPIEFIVLDDALKGMYFFG